MRRFFYITYILIFGGVFSSCSLDLEPRNSQTFEHFFRNEEDLYAVVAEMHGTLREGLASVSYQEHMGARVDWVSGKSAEFEKLRNLDPNTLTNRTKQQQWKRYYNVLVLADLFMDNFHKAQNVTPSRLNFCIGQAYFMRAVSYMNLARTWGDAVITKGSGYAGKYAKSPARAVVDTAINNAMKAFDILPKYSEMRGINGKALTSKQFGCKGSAAAVLAHLYAWKGSVFNDAEALAKAEEWADKLIEPQFREEVGTYTLAADPETVCTKTLVRTSDESIFEIEINFTESEYASFVTGAFMVNYPVKRNSALQDALDVNYGILRSTVRDMYGENDGRRAAYFYKVDDENVTNSAGLAYLYKWRYTLYRQSGGGEPAAFRNLDCNKVLIRLADIYLLRAECRVKLGDTGGAASDLNEIRGRAGADLYPALGEGTSPEDLQRLIFLEREKELLLEGQRYYDVVRNGRSYVNTYLNGEFRNLTDADIANGALYLPIPEPAFNNNDLMIQNTYWLSKMK